MSIKIMNHVWEHADAKGSDLLMLLALADAANNDGECWPKIDTLAKKVRCKKRNTQKVLRRLQENGEIIIQERNGSSHNYTVVIDPDEKQRLKAYWTEQKAQGDAPQYTPQDVPDNDEGDAPQYTPGMHHSTPQGMHHSTHKPNTIEPSLNQEHKKDSSPAGESQLFSTIEERHGVGVGEDWLAARWQQQGITPAGPLPDYPQWDWKDHIVRVWGDNKKGIAGWILSQVLGTATRGQWKEFRFDDPAKPEELYAFRSWWRRTYPQCTLPTKAETIRMRFDEFRGCGDYGWLCSFFLNWLRQEAAREVQAQAIAEQYSDDPIINRKAEVDAMIAGVIQTWRSKVSA